MYFWMNYRIGNAYLADKRAEYESGLEYIDKALTLIPPLRAGEMPHENEVMARAFRAKALQKLGDISGAIAEYRVCLAAIRLLDYHGKVDMEQSNHMLISKTTNFTSILLGLVVERKIQEGAERPYFSHDERLDLMKELGFGMYSDNSLKCSCCEKTDLELAKLKKKLVLCANCKGAWYCGRQCQKEAWKKGHSKICGKAKGVQSMQVSYIAASHFGLGHLCLYRDSRDSSVLVLLKDKSTDQIFDALTDQEYDIDKEGLKERSAEYYYHTMHNDLIQEEEVREMFGKARVTL